MDTLRDKLWIWGHPENCFFNQWGNHIHSRMTPAEGALYLGARNMFMVPMGLPINPTQYNMSLTTMREVGWAIDHAADNPYVVESLLEQAARFPNISCGIFDDFVGQGNLGKRKVEDFNKVRDRLHHNQVRPLEMWMVLYTREFGLGKDDELTPFIQPFDGITMWTWEEKDIGQFEEKYALFKRLTEGKRRKLGCYLYNFGEYRQATGSKVLWQLDRYAECIRKGEVEGIILHTNAMADLGYEAVEAARSWVLRHGDEPV